MPQMQWFYGRSNLPAAQAPPDPEPRFEASPYRAYAARRGMVVPAVGEGSWAEKTSNHESFQEINIELMQSWFFFVHAGPRLHDGTSR